jgi:hypothetical protein
VRQRDLVALVGLIAWGLLVLHPVLDAHFVLVDDHEILALVPPVGSAPEARPALDLRGMAFNSDPSVGRFRPLYWTIRYGEIELLGDNAGAWHALVLGIGLLTSALLFGAARTLGAPTLAALLLGAWLLVAPGVSSLWVRLGADDTVASFFFVLAIFAAVQASRRRGGPLWASLFVVASAAAVLSKEAFTLAAIGLAAFYALVSLRASRRVPIAAWVVLAMGIVTAGTAFAIGAGAGPLSYGGRYLALPTPGEYVRSVAQNSAIVVFAALGWVLALAAWHSRHTSQWRAAWLVCGCALVLIVPQLLLYSQQGIMEGKYEDAAAIGMAGWAMASLVWLRRQGRNRLFRTGLGAWAAMVLLFGFSTWTYARFFVEDSHQLTRLVDKVAMSAPSGATVGIAGDAARQYEPIVSLTDHIAHRGRADVQFAVLPLMPERPYSPLEDAFARDLTSSTFSRPLRAAGGCHDLGSMIVLGDEHAARAALPCLADGFRRVEFNSQVLLWGGDSVSLRPRLPGVSHGGYMLLLPDV